MKNTTKYLPALEIFLKSENFYYLSVEDFKQIYSGEELIEYDGWHISLDIPNGEILAVGIEHIETFSCWQRSTYREFGYFDSDGIIAYAKTIISKWESMLEVLKS